MIELWVAAVIYMGQTHLLAVPEQAACEERLAEARAEVDPNLTALSDQCVKLTLTLTGKVPE